jgi:tight adherence protein B
VLSVGIFVAVTAAALVGLNLSAGGRRDRGVVRRRLEAEFAAAGGPAVGALYKNLGTLDADPPADRPAAPTETIRQRFDWFVRRSGLPFTANQVLAASAALGLVLGGLGWWGARAVGAAAGGGLGAAVPVMLVGVVARRRKERLIVQLAAGFEQMGRVLRAGQSVAEALRAVVETTGPPLADEFAGCLHQIELGIRPDDAFQELGRGASVVELRLFVLAMAVHRQTGGNLAEVLDRLASITRGRVRLRQKINALTAEGRLQSVTLVVLPPLTFAVMFVLNRPYAESLLAQPQLLAATAALMAVGVAWTRTIINFEG